MKGELLFFVELIGIVAFSVSGAVSAFRKHMDLFGIIILGACTALGGGALRDIMLGITPPAMFKNPVYAAVAALASLAVFIPQVRRLIGGNRAYEIVMLVMDSLGLGVFTVVGIQTALEKNGDYAPFLLVCVGVLTGVGGGVLRDVLAGERPYVFVKHFYACASLIGAVLCVFQKIHRSYRSIFCRRLGSRRAETFGGGVSVEAAEARTRRYAGRFIKRGKSAERKVTRLPGAAAYF